LILLENLRGSKILNQLIMETRKRVNNQDVVKLKKI
jgi:hypothetical protein